MAARFPRRVSRLPRFLDEPVAGVRRANDFIRTRKDSGRDGTREEETRGRRAEPSRAGEETRARVRDIAGTHLRSRAVISSTHITRPREQMLTSVEPEAAAVASVPGRCFPALALGENERTDDDDDDDDDGQCVRER